MKTNFTKEELFEIEKVFDIMVIENTKQTSSILFALEQSKTNTNKLSDVIFQDIYKMYNTYRTISAKAQSMRNKE